MINLDDFKNIPEVLMNASANNEKIFVVLVGGKEYFGKVKKTADPNFFTVREIVEKEYYDAIFRVDHVIALEVKARDR